ncbi:MAG: T9SS type A sorting domain-containing protein [Ignavibacteriaceae bacterium]|nr:T9SS type A sorting domain-containing protein [Ignavibacteriaceae bacterium]
MKKFMFMLLLTVLIVPVSAQEESLRGLNLIDLSNVQISDKVKKGENLPENLILTESFENGAPGWQFVRIAGNGTPNWHISGLFSTTGNFAAAGFNQVTGFIEPSVTEVLVTPPINLQNLDRAEFSFDLFLDIPYSNTGINNFFTIQISTDGGATWQQFLNYLFAGQLNQWFSFPFDASNYEDCDLTPYIGETVMLRFVQQIGSNTVPQAKGVIIDNFVVSGFVCDSDPYEPNNSIALAFPISYGFISDGALICPAEDVDTYKFNAVKDEFVKISATNQLNNYIFIALRDANGSLIAYNYYSNDLVQKINTTGTYYITIAGNNSSPSFSGAYQLTLDTLSVNPDILTVSDIPDDEGLQVRVTWKNSYLDPQTGPSGISNYLLFRKVNDTTGLRSEIKEFDFTSEILLGGSTIYMIENELWDFIQTIPAVPQRPFLNYSYVAPTLNNNEAFTFMVAAIPIDNYPVAVYWGREGSGISIDNNAPAFNSFNLSMHSNGYSITWDVNTTQYPDVSYFKIYRSDVHNFEANPSTAIVQLDHNNRSYLDANIVPGKSYFYIIEVSDHSGNKRHTPVLNSTLLNVENNEGVPAEFRLFQNYPNPFNPQTTIKIAIPESGNIQLTIYDQSGTLVETLFDGYITEGYYNFSWNASNYASGVYFYKLTSNTGINRVNKMIYLK